ncbi:MAG: ABC transporter substrate-binding protein [Candidatus Wildermuthbacteria bacterium]|nr:ABC transporter substrate-binding protein [Candidatus Wildermuthbacteria bacterium]
MNLPRIKPYLLAGILLIIAAGAGAFWYISRFSEKPADPFVVVLPMWDSPPGRPVTEGFIKKMEELGYKEGVDVVYKRHGFFAPGPETLEKIKNIYGSDLAEGVDLILASEYSDTKAAQDATRAAGKMVPIVFADITNPIEFGFAKDWSHPGSNLTGVAERRNDVVEKSLDLFISIVPGIKKIGIASTGFMLPGEPSVSYYKALLDEAEKKGIEIVEYKTDVPPGPGLKEEVMRIFNSIKPGEIDAWIHIPGHFFTNQQTLEHELALRLKISHMLPAIEHNDETGDLVGFFTYGADFIDKGAQTAVFADKILRGGASASDISLEFPVKYKIMINLKTAEAIGVTVPAEILEIADVVVK